MQLKKNINPGNLNNYLIILIFYFLLIFTFEANSNEILEGQNTDLKVLDKISSKNELIKLNNNEEYIYKDLGIKSMKCTNSEFDDNPEIKLTFRLEI